jgi:hypothetical protein
MTIFTNIWTIDFDKNIVDNNKLNRVFSEY